MNYLSQLEELIDNTDNDIDYEGYDIIGIDEEYVEMFDGFDDDIAIGEYFD